MDFGNLAFAIAIGVGIWLLMRYLPKPRRRSGPGAPPAAEPVEPATMPRVGEPGTVSPAQIEVLNKNYLPIDTGWSREEASLVLDALAYLRAVCRHVAPRREAPEEVQNALLHYILIREDLREHVRLWARDRRGDQDTVYLEAGPDALPDTPARAEVATEAQRLLGTRAQN